MAAATAASGCYYAQSAIGHLDLIARREPITTLIADTGTDPQLRNRLERTLAMREFSVSELHLPDNPSYTTYAAIDRPYAVWNVYATPALSVDAVKWCFPIAGCVSYRGYFDQDDALAFADKYRRDGYDVFIAGVPAYSTLGWFDDPVLSTVIAWPEPELAGLMFHELAHQVVYASDDTAFNESFATAVELEGVARWLQRQGAPGAFDAFRRRQCREETLVQLILGYRERLAAIYAAERPDDDKRERKQQTLAALEADYRALRTAWGENPGRGLPDQTLNNAFFVPYADYYRWTPAFAALLRAHGGHFPAFYTAVGELARTDPEERASRLLALTTASPSGEELRVARDYRRACRRNSS